MDDVGGISDMVWRVSEAGEGASAVAAFGWTQFPHFSAHHQNG